MYTQINPTNKPTVPPRVTNSTSTLATVTTTTKSTSSTESTSITTTTTAANMVTTKPTSLPSISGKPSSMPSSKIPSYLTPPPSPEAKELTYSSTAPSSFPSMETTRDSSSTPSSYPTMSPSTPVPTTSQKAPPAPESTLNPTNESSTQPPATSELLCLSPTSRDDDHEEDEVKPSKNLFDHSKDFQSSTVPIFLFSKSSKTKNIFYHSKEDSQVNQPIFGVKSGKSKQLFKSKSSKRYRRNLQTCSVGTCIDKKGECDTIVHSTADAIYDYETVLEGTMHLSLIQEGSSPMVTCEDMIQLEELTLNFLADNVGSEDTFLPACVHIVEHVYDRQVTSEGVSESTAFKVELTFIDTGDTQGLRKRRELVSSQKGRNLSECSLIDRALCCSQHAMNNDIIGIGSFCDKLGCSQAFCGEGRHKVQRRQLRVTQTLELLQMPQSVTRRAGKAGKGSKSSTPGAIHSKSAKSSRSSVQSVPSCPWYGLFSERAFKDIVSDRTSFQPAKTDALLNATDTGVFVSFYFIYTNHITSLIDILFFLTSSKLYLMRHSSRLCRCMQCKSIQY